MARLAVHALRLPTYRLQNLDGLAQLRVRDRIDNPARLTAPPRELIALIRLLARKEVGKRHVEPLCCLVQHACRNPVYAGLVLLQLLMRYAQKPGELHKRHAAGLTMRPQMRGDP